MDEARQVHGPAHADATMSTDATTSPAEPSAPPPDPAAILRSRGFVGVLVLAAAVGLLVSLISWGFLELANQAQDAVFTDLPDALGYPAPPWWYYLLVLGLAGVPVALAITRLPGHGGHVPVFGLQTGGKDPASVPGVALAGFASLALGAVVGPEAPLIALGAGLAAFGVRRARKDAPRQLVTIMAAAGSFAAVSVIFGSPIVAAVLMMEAIGLGGAMLSLVMVPGLVAAGIGSLVFVGMASWTGLSTSAYSLGPLQLAPFSGITWQLIGWTLALGLAGALLTHVVRRVGLAGWKVVSRSYFVGVPVAGLAVAALALLFERTTVHGAPDVLFSGQKQLPGLVDDPAAWSLGALAMVML